MGCVCGRLPQGTGSFFCHALNLPFTDKGIQACRLKINRALGQSVVCRHFWAGVVVVVVVVVVNIEPIQVIYKHPASIGW